MSNERDLGVYSIPTNRLEPGRDHDRPEGPLSRKPLASDICTPPPYGGKDPPIERRSPP